MPASSTPSVRQFMGQNGEDGATFGNNAASLVGMHGAAVIQAGAIAAPTDLATSIVAINAIRVALTAKGITA